MEGNFYVLEKVVRQKLRSRSGTAALQCKDDMDLYSKCVEKAQINRDLRLNSCKTERDRMMDCYHKIVAEDNKGKARKAK